MKETADEHAGKRLCPGIEPGLVPEKPDGVPEHWVHASRFKRRERVGHTVEGGKRVSRWHYDPLCKTCQQKLRLAAKHEDEATWAVERFASRRASVCGQTKQFMLDEMNCRRLVPEVRATLEHGCISCGEPVKIEELQFDHRLRPRYDGDLAREHARNIQPLDANCNGAACKGPKDLGEWLDNEEDARLAAHADRLAATPPASPPVVVAGADRCPSVKAKVHGDPPRRSSWRCQQTAGHAGPHTHRGQSPWTESEAA